MKIIIVHLIRYQVQSCVIMDYCTYTDRLPVPNFITCVSTLSGSAYRRFMVAVSLSAELSAAKYYYKKVTSVSFIISTIPEAASSILLSVHLPLSLLTRIISRERGMLPCGVVRKHSCFPSLTVFPAAGPLHEHSALFSGW